MGWGRKKNTTEEPDPTGLDDQQLSTSQEAVPLPWLAGERKIAVKWISRIYNQFAREAPVERGSKK
jgi:hypothetical protein